MKRAILKKLLICGLLSQTFITFLPGTSSGLTIDEAVALALKNNPELQKQHLNQAVTEGALSGQKSQNFGKIDLLASYGHYNLPRTLAPLTPASIFNDPTAVPTTKDLFTTGVMYEVPLFTGFAQQRSVEIAVLEKEITRTTINLSREQLIYNVKTLYVAILSLQTQQEAQRAYQNALQRLYDDISFEVELGKKARVEQLKAAADLENARVKTRRIGGNIRIMHGSLARLLNIDLITDLEALSMPIPTVAAAVSVKEIQDLDRYRSATLTVEKTAKLVEKSNAVYYPQLTFNGFYGQNFGPNDSTNLHAGDWNNQEIWQAVVNLKWTVFDFGRRKTQRQIAVIREQQSRQEQLATELELKRALSEANIKIEMAMDEFNSAKIELALTRETEIIEQTRFDQGATGLNDLLYAKARNQLALSNSITAQHTYQTARFYLDYLQENGGNK